MKYPRRYLVSLVSFLALTLSVLPLLAQEKQVMLLGVYHFASNNDMMKTTCKNANNNWSLIRVQM